MENNISIEMNPTSESLSLIRLIVSYFTQTLDFTISDIDHVKETITKLMLSMHTSLKKDEKVKIDIVFNDKQLEAIIYCVLIEAKTLLLNKNNDIFRNNSESIKKLHIEELSENRFAIHLLLEKRDQNG